MNVIEVIGPPGVGKSTLCNDLWPPSVEWDGLPPPASWAPFIACAQRLAQSIKPDKRPEHWLSMFDKAVRKAATLQRLDQAGAYAGVGLVMRGIDLAWRGPPSVGIGEYLWQVPRPAAVVSMIADIATIEARNVERGKSRPSRRLAHLAGPGLAAQLDAVAILRARGVPLLEIDTREDVDANRARIVAFAGGLVAAA